ncbi:MAG: 30S ribosomal protein S16 [Candidatus Spechtbacteria bacterium RIFCSPHIGHO2_02_FULL_43_15b]|uniref:Small ribosomal subunit protein bS16 n=1 Tax=Candidatus Spechtbacteria bacterium RIFCSPHIGHO2_01_FULL_43_30 TaxID=1802158 RepID=A0A1G2H834_9BACT|nr:MAG: 30S ribosomal protein S16 [Candidatus Spechtbacteria bacterium RIFCSPHIGHO2_01_FULL_43_30]OGZ59098.1 MAG: 30S ribosomal protein S16 [Candidatus Spechtbacteria bacterium RIFCSPHIGHO2_02_FULL_43_15b]
MLRIRLIRNGKRNRPNYRLAVLPQRSSSQSGRFLEVLGHYDPLKKDRSFKKERIEYWISKGAIPSDSAKNMLISCGILEGKKIAVHKKSKKSAEPEADKAVTEANASVEKNPKAESAVADGSSAPTPEK